MRVRWLRVAERNLDELAAYIAEDDPDAADRMVTRIVTTIELLRENPAMGKAGRVTGTRELVVADTPFIVPYRVRDDVVTILRVIHGARRPKSF